MSMNVLITASREVTFKKPNGKVGTDVQTIKFDAIQTPTGVTMAIINSADPAKAYIAHIESNLKEDEQIPIFAEDDIFEKGEPIGFETYNFGEEHIQEFKDFLKEAAEEGFVVEFGMI